MSSSPMLPMMPPAITMSRRPHYGKKNVMEYVILIAAVYDCTVQYMSFNTCSVETSYTNRLEGKIKLKRYNKFKINNMFMFRNAISRTLTSTIVQNSFFI